VLLPDGRQVRALPLPSPTSVAVTLAGAAVALILWRGSSRAAIGRTAVLLGLGGLNLGLTALALYRVLYPLLREQATTSAERRACIEEELRARLAAATETTE